MADHLELETLVAPFVLGACEADEAELVRRHLAGCASCRELARRLGAAAEHLALSVQEAVPPPGLKARILAAAIESGAPDPDLPPAPAPQPRPAPRIRLGGAPWWSRLRPAPAAAFALAVLVLLLGGYTYSLSRQVSDLRTRADARYAMAGTGAMAGADATVVSLRREDLTVLDFRNMPPLEAGRVYELWFLDSSGNAVPAAVFQGSGLVSIRGDLAGVRTLAVTVETGPEGSKAPTQAPQMTGTVA